MTDMKTGELAGRMTDRLIGSSNWLPALLTGSRAHVFIQNDV